jgi:Family of unknown function (DUF5832)
MNKVKSLKRNIKKIVKPPGPVEDHLDEDPAIVSQMYFLFSYFHTGDPDVPVMFKMRGAKASREEANKLAKKINKEDPYFHIFVCETGKWGGLPTPDKLSEIMNSDDSLDVNYLDTKMNELMKTHKDKLIEAKEFDSNRKKMMTAVDHAQESKETQKNIESTEEYIENLTKDLKELENSTEPFAETKKKQYIEDLSNSKANVERMKAELSKSETLQKTLES